MADFQIGKLFSANLNEHHHEMSMEPFSAYSQLFLSTSTSWTSQIVQNIFPADTITTLIVRNNAANTVGLYTIGMIFSLFLRGKVLQDKDNQACYFGYKVVEKQKKVLRALMMVSI
jgi:hypothetical protein